MAPGNCAQASTFPQQTVRGSYAMSSTLLLIIVIILLIGALPTWPYSANWGYFPSGILGLIVVVLIIMALLGRV
jgi:hypothetical protein